MARGKRVWVTRAEPGAEHTAARLREAGHAPLVAPLIEVRRLEREPLDMDGVGALAFTSANAVRAYARLGARSRPPAYVVGEATADAAREAGLPVRGSGDGGVEALAALIAADAERPAGSILHPCAKVPAGDLEGLLAAAGIAARRATVYETVDAKRLPDAADDAIRAGRLDAILLHSPRAARVLARLLHVTRLEFKLDDADVLGLSPACLVPVQMLRCRARRPAEVPREGALLSLLGPGSRPLLPWPRLGALAPRAQAGK